MHPALLEHKAQADDRNRNGETAAWVACKHGQVAMLELLAKSMRGDFAAHHSFCGWTVNKMLGHRENTSWHTTIGIALYCERH
eukprot:m.83079 g.83079  ORF g.83079 m.83079 type:complete len:83 (-) comp14646_c0_seq1:1190-1438(-)